MISLHDHHIRGFSVEVAKKLLRLETELPTPPRSRRALGVFEGVEAYVLRGDMLATIIFGIDEMDPMMLYDEYAENLRATYGRSGGHAPWVVGREDAVRFVAMSGLRGFDLSSSIGCTGAIWARSYRAEWTGTSSDAA